MMIFYRTPDTHRLVETSRTEDVIIFTGDDPGDPIRMALWAQHYRQTVDGDANWDAAWTLIDTWSTANHPAAEEPAP